MEIAAHLARSGESTVATDLACKLVCLLGSTFCFELPRQTPSIWWTVKTTHPIVLFSMFSKPLYPPRSCSPSNLFSIKRQQEHYSTVVVYIMFSQTSSIALHFADKLARSQFARSSGFSCSSAACNSWPRNIHPVNGWNVREWDGFLLLFLAVIAHVIVLYCQSIGHLYLIQLFLRQLRVPHLHKSFKNLVIISIANLHANDACNDRSQEAIRTTRNGHQCMMRVGNVNHHLIFRRESPHLSFIILRTSNFAPSCRFSPPSP